MTGVSDQVPRTKVRADFPITCAPTMLRGTDPGADLDDDEPMQAAKHSSPDPVDPVVSSR